MNTHYNENISLSLVKDFHSLAKFVNIIGFQGKKTSQQFKPKLKLFDWRGCSVSYLTSSPCTLFNFLVQVNRVMLQYTVPIYVNANSNSKVIIEIQISSAFEKFPSTESHAAQVCEKIYRRQ